MIVDKENLGARFYTQNVAFWSALTSMHNELRELKSPNHQALMIEKCPICLPSMIALRDLGWEIPGFMEDSTSMVMGSTGFIG